jgi:hypothetical protein
MRTSNPFSQKVTTKTKATQNPDDSGIREDPGAGDRPGKIIGVFIILKREVNSMDDIGRAIKKFREIWEKGDREYKRRLIHNIFLSLFSTTGSDFCPFNGPGKTADFDKHDRETKEFIKIAHIYVEKYWLGAGGRKGPNLPILDKYKKNQHYPGSNIIDFEAMKSKIVTQGNRL